MICMYCTEIQKGPDRGKSESISLIYLYLRLLSLFAACVSLTTAAYAHSPPPPHFWIHPARMQSSPRSGTYVWMEMYGGVGTSSSIGIQRAVGWYQSHVGMGISHRHVVL